MKAKTADRKGENRMTEEMTVEKTTIRVIVCRPGELAEVEEIEAFQAKFDKEK